jgi:hypothetical protein
MPVDLEIRTRNRAAEARCRACRKAEDPGMEEWPALSEHSCTRPATPPRATVQARLRRNQEIRAARELRIRRERLADLDA